MYAIPLGKITHLQYELSQSTQCQTGGVGPRHRSSSQSTEGSFSLDEDSGSDEISSSSSRRAESEGIVFEAPFRDLRHRAVLRRVDCSSFRTACV